ncbi:MAG: transposase [Blastocatellia bacterium]|nr:transposase [Blastocatellia bacterium]
MDWETQLIQIYLCLDEAYEPYLAADCQRLSPNQQPLAFTDVEAMTLYLFGHLKEKRTVQAIYDYAVDHLRAWFPRLPSYQAFAQRLNFLAGAFVRLTERLHTKLPPVNATPLIRVLDSLPIVLANAARSGRARIAPDLAAKGYCAAKKMYDYGVKLHIVATRRAGQLPLPEVLLLTPANEFDLTCLRQLDLSVRTGYLIGDKAYQDASLQNQLTQSHALTVLTPVKKRKGQTELGLFEELYSTSMSQLRQPIESLGNWLGVHTDIQHASHVRSQKGLLVHVFGRLALALMLFIFHF